MEKKKRIRDTTWEDYGISKHRYSELKAFCLQYPEKKEQINYGLTSHEPAEGLSGRIGRPTENQAVSNSPFIKDCLMIENAAREASSELYRWILASVTEDLSYDELGDVPICRNDFYGVRRKFYYCLHLKKK